MVTGKEANNFFYLGRCGSLIVHPCIYKDSLQEGMVVLNFETIGNLFFLSLVISMYIQNNNVILHNIDR